MPITASSRFGTGLARAGQGLVSNFGKRAPAWPVFISRKVYSRFALVGITKDSNGTALGGCVVKCFKTDGDALLGITTSDVDGNYKFDLGQNAGYFYVVAYKAGSPDVARTTVNTLDAPDAQPIVNPATQVDVLARFEDGSANGTAVTATILNNGTIGSGGVWSLGGAGPWTGLTVSTAQEKTVSGLMIPGGSGRGDAGATRSIKANCQTDSFYGSYDFSGKDRVTVGCAIMFKAFTNTFQFYNPIAMNGSGGAYNVVSFQTFSPMVVQAETSDLGAIGDTFTVVNDKWYWFTLLWDKASLKGAFKFYDMATTPFTYLGGGIGGIANEQCINVQIGRTDNHDVFENADLYYDDVAIDLAGTNWPLLPGEGY